MTDELIMPFERSREAALSRRGFGALALGGGVAVASAAAAGDLPVTEADVTVKTADGLCDAAFMYPEGTAVHPGVVIFTDILGLRPAFRAMGRRLAAQGYAVLIPNPFYRTHKSPVVDGPFDFAKPEDRAKLGEFTKALAQPGAKQADINAYLAYLEAAPQVSKARFGVAGYCMGGPYTMMAAASSPRVGAAGSFHGGGLVTDKPDSPHLSIPKMKADYLVAIADGDDQKQPAAKDTLKAAFAQAGLRADVQVFTGCQHGWCVTDGAAYNRDGAERAWAKLLALFNAALV